MYNVTTQTHMNMPGVDITTDGFTIAMRVKLSLYDTNKTLASLKV